MTFIAGTIHQVHLEYWVYSSKFDKTVSDINRQQHFNVPVEGVVGGVVTVLTVLTVGVVKGVVVGVLAVETDAVVSVVVTGVLTVDSDSVVNEVGAVVVS